MTCLRDVGCCAVVFVWLNIVWLVMLLILGRFDLFEFVDVDSVVCDVLFCVWWCLDVGVNCAWWIGVFCCLFPVCFG